MRTNHPQNKEKKSEGEPKFAKPGTNMQDANSKATLENPSSRPLGNTEPQPTFSKTSVARTKSSHM